MNTPVACSLRVAASTPKGGAAGGLAEPVPRRPLALHDADVLMAIKLHASTL